MGKRDNKITDTLVGASRSRLDSYWSSIGFKNFYKRFRRGMSLPKSYLTTINKQEKINKTFKLRGFQFGNWVTNEDRFNYLAAVVICMHDLNKVIRFKNNIGLDGSLGISIGARGRSSASAHFEPSQEIINITRYDRGSEFTKLSRFIYTGGVGAFAHEYGHYIDYFFGTYIDQERGSNYISGGRSHSKLRLTKKTKGFRYLMDNVIESIIWKKDKKLSPYYIRLKNKTDSEYWFRRTEIFARIFEQYIGYKLNKKGIYNTFLSETKYDTSYYLNKSELKIVIPKIDALISEMRKYI